LETVEQHTRSLVDERLRSSAAVISRLSDLIVEAQRLGHSHSAIYARLEAGGLRTSWNNYRSSLVRAKKGSCVAATQTPPDLQVRSGCGDEPQPDRVSESTATASATHVLDALRQAREVASKDYSRIAREHYRKDRK
jgi:hypothetical protein